MTSLVLVDSSAWVQSLRRKGDTDVRARVHELLVGDSAAWCDIVRVELWNGVRGDEEQQRLRDLDERLPRLPISDAVWELACHTARRARSSGVTVPSNDLVIFACAKTYGVRIEHVDKHYELLQNLPTS
ncbi:MAG TPA: PIN domain-containing protein [Tepidisphaeraceae bacterium]|nr:PIN domain-containing protein [Tepidisphaeraceae bacterium]